MSRGGENFTTARLPGEELATVWASELAEWANELTALANLKTLGARTMDVQKDRTAEERPRFPTKTASRGTFLVTKYTI